MAHLKVKNEAPAEDDATSALQIDPHHFKSYQRRCVARLSMGKVRAAMIDVCAAENSCVRFLKETGEQDGDHVAAASSSLAEIQKLRTKADNALAHAAKRAPRRKLPVTVVT